MPSHNNSPDTEPMKVHFAGKTTVTAVGKDALKTIARERERPSDYFLLLTKR